VKLQAHLSNSPRFATLTLGADGGFVYTPRANFFGSDFFFYRVSDGLRTSAPTQVKLQVNPVNDAPQGGTFSFSTREDKPVLLVLKANDVDGGHLAWNLKNSPRHGVLSRIESSSFGVLSALYTPNTDFEGTDTLVFEVSDGHLSALVTANIAVTPVNDAPLLDLNGLKIGGLDTSVVWNVEPMAIAPDVFVSDVEITNC